MSGHVRKNRTSQNRAPFSFSLIAKRGFNTALSKSLIYDVLSTCRIATGRGALLMMH
jgi:hypothetical protein